MSCLILTPEIRELAKKFPNETEQSVLNLVSLWQEKNNKSIEDIPMGYELRDFIKEIRKDTPSKWARTAENGYEVSTKGDKRFSALVATFKEGTIIDGVDIGGRTIEDVYQSVIKKSRKGQAPSKDSKLYNESLKTKEEREDFSYTEGYLPLWQEWAKQNPELMDELRAKSAGKTLTDQFANTRVSQARALADILNSTTSTSVSKGLRTPKIKGTETRFSTSESNSYPSRTKENADWSDITIAFAIDFNTAGEKLTKNLAGNKYISSALPADSNYEDSLASNNENAYSYHANEIYKQLKAKGKLKNIKLNIAGNGIYSLRGFTTQEELNEYITNVIKTLQNLGVTISEIRSGGQTGVDEAGIIAAQRLEIPNEVHSTANFMFRDKSGKDISDEQAFKDRFLTTSSRPEEAKIDTLSSVFDTPRITTIEEQQKVDLLFDPQTRRDRVTLIARLFSNEVDSVLQEITDSLKRRIDDASGIEKEELQTELNNLDRFSAIKIAKPAGIFKRVANIFNSYVQDTEEGRIQQELNAINSMKGADKFSDEQKLEAAKKKAAYKNQEYKKIVDDPYVYKALAEEVSTLLIMTEGIRIDPNYIAPADANLNDDDPNGNSEVDNEADDWRQEEAYKDGWMTNFRQVSSHESLSQAVRKAIRQVPRLDYRGKYEKDDLGFTRYLDADYVHATLIDKLRNMITSDDMLPLMQDLQRTKPWVKQVTKLLQSDETLFSQFYQDFRKDFVSYWIQKKKINPDGTFKMETIAINKPEGIYYLLDAWRDNYENGIQLDDNSVYDKNGEINKDNAVRGLQWTETLNNMFQNLDTESRLQLLEREDVWGTIMKLLHMLGIDANPSILKTALTDIKTAPGITFTDPIMLLLPQLNIIFSGIKKGEVKSETREDGSEKRGDLINTFGSAYNMIASMMAEVTEDAIESSVRENDKSYYSHVTPNYLGKLIKNLKNVMNDKERFEQFMQTEFKQYEWFFKGGHWRNDWLRQLAESDELRKGLNHKVVLNSDKVDYTNWDDLDYTLALLTEYWGDPDSAKSSIKYAWYHVPILSDSPSAEFIRFRKYTTGDVLDENGKKRTYDDVILDKLVDLVNQEYDRIMLVRERDEAYQSGDKSVEPIANYDIVRKTDGSIKSIGGAEFKFLPALNDIKYDNGETFIDRLSRLKSKGTGAELREFLRNSLNDMMEDGFEQTYRDWMRVGLLDELPNGKYKYLPFEGQSKQNAITAKALTKAKNALGSLFNTNMELMLRAYNNNSAFDSREANNLMEQIKALLTDKVTRGEMELKDAQSISRSLFVKNNAKDALREYYWNSKLATSQIIQLTTTDLAFYKNLEDFQKRFKEVHAPALRLNTKATYKGKKIGRDWERTIYLKDDEIVSSVLEDIKTVLDERVKKGEMTKMDRDNIIYKFKNVNVADAQAYRSLSSYRAILGMSGQWTDDMEQAYNNFKSGNWNIKDFNIIWQTKKPFVYTQVNKIVGYHKKQVPLVDKETGTQVVDEKGNLKFTEIDDIENPIYQKVPVQHKNSEFLLLAMHELIAGPLGKSDKLRAINKFMEDNQIDVVQFESTTKVGKQSTINLNTKLNMTSEEKAELDSKLNNGEITQEQYNKVIEENTVPITSYKDTMIVLKEETGIGTGHENPNVVHKISYEDYGIQTATPEHAIDAVQLVGTQIRKLITADISNDAIIEVNGKKMTKKEWLDLYNEINTENILQAFIGIDEIFKDPKKVEEILLEEIRGNQRYGIDMIRACTLDENNNFNIPLFDPVQSQRVQTLINSVIKSRITKQKIRGGALIQVSDYGLTDELHIVFEGEGANKRIKYLECYMPAYSREFYEPLMDPNTHQLDVTKLPDDLRKLIGYRVPTEDKYSMAPLYIKGFLPQQNGSAIMLPAEITTLSGSD